MSILIQKRRICFDDEALYNLKQGSVAWIEARKTIRSKHCFGSSALPALSGLVASKSRFKQLVALATDSDGYETAANWQQQNMQLGKIAEPVILEAFSKDCAASL